MNHKKLFSLAICSLPLVMPGRAAAVSARPNILWVVSEDNTANYVGAYGDPLARTPRLDQLSAKGIVFDRAYAVAPVCAPSRSSIITGCYASGLGTQHMRSQRALPAGVRFFPEFLREAGYFCTNNAKTDYNTSTPFAVAWDENGKNAHWRHRQPGQSFFAIFNTELSHESRLFEREALVTDPAKVRVPAYLPDTPETRADLAQYYDSVNRADAAIGRILDQLKEDGLADDTIIFYYSDHGGVLPRSKRFLYENGTHAALIAYFPEKYRALAPSAPGTRVGELVSFIDLAPTVLNLAGLPRPAQFQGRAFAGEKRDPAPALVHMFRDRMDERYDLSRAVTDGRFRYIRHYLPHRPSGQHLFTLWREASMKRWDELYRAGQLNATQRAFFEPKPVEELFDCEADPDKVRNLAADPAHRQRLEQFRAASRAHLLSIRDTGFMPEPLMVALAGTRSPWLATTQPDLYPLERVLALVDAVQLDKGDDRAAAKALSDSSPVMRYWSVVAGLSRGVPRDVTSLLTDTEPCVRVAAAEAMLRQNPGHAAAWRVLEEAFDPKQPRELRLVVLNALAFLPAPPAALRALIETAAKAEADEKNDEYVPRAASYLLEVQPAAQLAAH